MGLSNAFFNQKGLLYSVVFFLVVDKLRRVAYASV